MKPAQTFQSMKTNLIPSLLVLALSAGNVLAENPDATLRKLLNRVESLEAEVRQLRAEKSRGGSGKETVPVEESATPLADEGALHGSFPQLKIRGFGDVEYHWADRGADKNAFRLGALDLFFTSQLTENVSALAETVIEADDEEHFGFEIERLVLQYTPREWFNVAVGRYHTAIGYYNNAYHHGKWLQTAVGRPKIFEFEDNEGILPIHNVGVSVSGAVPSGRLGLRYVAEIGNGRRYEAEKEAVQNVTDNNKSKSLNLALFARPDWLPGLQAGASVYFDRLSAALLPDVRQTILSAHVVYVSPEFEWLNEGVLVRDSSRLGTFETYGFYTQVARRFGQFRPYVRYELLAANGRDPVMQAAGETDTHQTLSLGVRYDFTSLAAFKLQWDHTIEADDNDAREALTLQLSFTF